MPVCRSEQIQGVLSPVLASVEDRHTVAEKEAGMKVVAGIDVGKGELVVSVAGGPVQRFSNQAPGIQALLSWLRVQAVTHVVCEATGGYERQVVRHLRGSEMTVHVAHAARVRHFAQALGQDAKTDRLDARVLATYGEMFEVCGQSPQEGAGLALREALDRRQQLVDQRVQEGNRLEKGLRGRVKKSCERHVAWLDKEIARLDKACQEIVRRHGPLRERAALYESVSGVGSLTSAVLLAYLPELGQGGGKGLTALVGLAPWPHDSGGRRGQRSIRGGRVRRALYVASLSAIRRDGELGHFYRRLRRRGKAAKVALVAVMRKLLLQLHAVARRGTPWIAAGAPDA